jgi:hypothetical protein
MIGWYRLPRDVDLVLKGVATVQEFVSKGTAVFSLHDLIAAEMTGLYTSLKHAWLPGDRNERMQVIAAPTRQSNTATSEQPLNASYESQRRAHWAGSNHAMPNVPTRMLSWSGGIPFYESRAVDLHIETLNSEQTRNEGAGTEILDRQFTTEEVDQLLSNLRPKRQLIAPSSLFLAFLQRGRGEFFMNTWGKDWLHNELAQGRASPNSQWAGIITGVLLLPVYEETALDQVAPTSDSLAAQVMEDIVEGGGSGHYEVIFLSTTNLE